MGAWIVGWLSAPPGVRAMLYASWWIFLHWSLPGILIGRALGFSIRYVQRRYETSVPKTSKEFSGFGLNRRK